MNCEDFNDRLPEYLDETLSGAAQTAFREHALNCGACRRAAARQEALAKSIRLSFNRETQGLVLRPETRRNILNAVQRPEHPPAPGVILQRFFAALRRQPAWAGAALLCLALFVFSDRLRRLPAPRAKERRITYVIDVPIQTETHVYRRQNNKVVDAVVTGVGVIDASFSENN